MFFLLILCPCFDQHWAGPSFSLLVLHLLSCILLFDAHTRTHYIRTPLNAPLPLLLLSFSFLPSLPICDHAQTQKWFLCCCYCPSPSLTPMLFPFPLTSLSPHYYSPPLPIHHTSLHSSPPSFWLWAHVHTFSLISLWVMALPILFYDFFFITSSSSSSQHPIISTFPKQTAIANNNMSHSTCHHFMNWLQHMCCVYLLLSLLDFSPIDHHLQSFWSNTFVPLTTQQVPICLTVKSNNSQLGSDHWDYKLIFRRYNDDPTGSHGI